MPPSRGKGNAATGFKQSRGPTRAHKALRIDVLRDQRIAPMAPPLLFAALQCAS